MPIIEQEARMASLEDRFQKGLAIRERLGGGKGTLFKGSVPRVYDLAPDMYRIATESLYGSIWSRPGLELKHRAMVTLTACTVQLAATQVRNHVRTALNVGVMPEEILELFIMTAFYGGIPAAYSGIAIAGAVFDEENLEVKLPESFDPTIDSDILYQRGLAQHQALIPDVFGYHPSEPTQGERDLDVLMQEYLWGAIWTRPGLDTKSRIICALAALVVKGQYDLSTRRMIEGALRYGLSQTEIVEIGMHLALYVGLIQARAFMHIANTVFRSPEFSET
jgi:4-carboxymuconolactone decarboxylase